MYLSVIMFANSNMVCFFKKNTLKLFPMLCYCIGRRNVSREDAEEEQFTAILTLMEILTNLLSKDFLSFAEGLITYIILITFVKLLLTYNC